MTPKEKAKELFLKYKESILSFLSDNMKTDNAIDCALIAVDEIIDICSEDESAIITQLQYWQQVKQELLNL